MTVQAIPDGFHTITPFMLLDDVRATLDFLDKAFGAEVRACLTLPDGTVKHAQVKIGDSMIMFGTASPEFPAMKSFLHLYVEDMDAMHKSAVAAGATSLQDPNTEFYGDRSGGVMDAAGNVWWFATHVEDVSHEEIERRASDAAGQ